MEKDLSLVGLIEWMWAHKKLWISISLVTALIFWAASWLLPPVYSSSVVILPRVGSSGLGSLNQLAGLAGLSIEAPRNPEDIYGEIVASDTHLGKLAMLPSDEGRTLGEKLAKQLRIDDDDRKIQLFRLKEELRTDVLTLKTDDATGVMTLSARIPRSRALAKELANASVRLLDQHIREDWERRGLLRTNFIKSRLVEVQADLSRAQDAVTQFAVKNRSYKDSPELAQRHSELVMEMQAVLAVWTKLREQMEIEQIDAHGELHALRVLDWAQESIEPISPKRSFFLAMGLVIGFVLAVTIAGYRDARTS